MEVIPAIDLRGGRVVRLYQGDFARETVFSSSPADVARRWQEAGAPRIHVVDLDGAATGHPANLEAVREIAGVATVPLQVGGGIRTLETALKVVGLGAQRVVLGTAAVLEPDLVKAACRTLGREAVVVGIDARRGKVAVEGWAKSASLTPADLVRAMIEVGVGRFMYTDTLADGTLLGPNFRAVADLVEAVDAPIIASGGIRSLDDLERLAALGVEGAVVGTALYQGAIDLREAVARFKG